MSVVNSASPWTNSDSNTKRTPSIRKTIKLKPNEVSPNAIENFTDLPTIHNYKEQSNQRSSRVNDILNQMNDISAGDEQMGEFVPIAPPTANVNGDYPPVDNNRTYDPPAAKSFSEASNAMKNIQSNEDRPKYSNYQQSYDASAVTYKKPYYAKMGISSDTPVDNRMMERINYMVHLLELQQHEKTNNITEEFILYTFLGVFMIFLVDGFARTGKYTR